MCRTSSLLTREALTSSQSSAIPPRFFIWRNALTIMRKCSREGCGDSFSLTVRAGHNSGTAMAGRRRTYHEGRRYCSDTYRKLASKARRALQSSPKRRPVERRKPRTLTTPLSPCPAPPKNRYFKGLPTTKNWLEPNSIPCASDQPSARGARQRLCPSPEPGTGPGRLDGAGRRLAA